MNPDQTASGSISFAIIYASNEHKQTREADDKSRDWRLYSVRVYKIDLYKLTLPTIVSSSDKLCKQFETKSGLTNCRA